MGGIRSAFRAVPAGLALIACCWLSNSAAPQPNPPAPRFAGSPSFAGASGSFPLADEIAALEARIATLDGLSLTPKQLQLLLELVRSAQQIRNAYEREWAPLAVEQEMAFSAFLREDLMNVEFTPEMETRTAQANERGKELVKRFCEEINALEVAFYDALTSSQQGFLQGVTTHSRPVVSRKTTSSSASARARARRADAIEGELSLIHAEIHGAIGPIGRFLLSPYTEEMAYLRAGQAPVRLATQAAVAQDLAVRLARVRELRGAINLQNLINGLNLSVDQIPPLITAAKTVESAHSRWQAASSQPDPVAAPSYCNALYAVLSAQAAGQPISPNLLRELPLLRRQAFGQSRPFLSPRDRQALDRLHEECAGEIAALLSPGQQQVLIDFNPCLVPPKNLKDPVRAGQAHDSSPLVALLQRLRQVPEPMWEIGREEFLDRVLARVEEHQGRFGEDQRRAVLAQVSDIAEQARSMTKVDFSLATEELADKLRLVAKKKTLEEERDRLRGEDRVLMSKIRSFLFDPQMIPLLEFLGRQLEAGPVTQPVDLDALLPPAGCGEGQCAVNE